MVRRSRWSIPIPEVTLPTYLFGSPDGKLSDKPCLIESERPDSMYLTYETYRLWAKRLAAGLQKAGLKDGEPVLLYSGNTLFFPVVILGVVMAGGIFTGANPNYNARELAFQLDNAGARFLICSDASLNIGLDAASKLGFSKDRVFVFDNGFDTWEGRGQSAHGCPHWSKLLASEAEGKNFKWKEDKSLVDRTICLNYSSGTTGLPKGVEISNKNYVSNTIQHMYLTELSNRYKTDRENLRWLNFLPMYHAMAQTIYCVGGPAKGIPVYLQRKFDFHAMLQAVQDFKITTLSLVPPIVVAMAKSPDTKKYDLSSVTSVGSGAAPLGREIIVEFEKLWPNGQVNVQQGWGMTEVTCSGLGWDPNVRCQDFSVGEPNPNCEIKLVDDQLNEVRQGERGEILIRGPNIMKGYWKNPKATQETLLEGRWLRTGDIAYEDERGFFFVVDRIKELIKVKGLQVAPAELEAQLLEHPDISDAAVVGVTINGEEVPRAYVVPAAGKSIDEKQVVKWMEAKVSKHKRLMGGVKKVDAINKNPSGKILRRSYREQAAKEVGDSGKKDAKI